MLFPTHLLVVVPLVFETGLPALMLLAGSALPDIIDKSLPALGLTETYHSIAHSIFTVAFLTVAGSVYKPLFAFSLAYSIHVLLDVIQVEINEPSGNWMFVFWPVRFPENPLKLPPVKFLKHYIGTKAFYLEIFLWLATGVYLILTLG
jgi:hypothetical protein